jgi:ABC-type proline/glycine betaine transport system permease subunit
MLSKLLEEVGKRLVALIEARKYGVTTLAVAFTVGAAFLLLQYFGTNPSAIQTITSKSFLCVVAVTVGVGLAVAMKQAKSVPRGLALGALAAYAAAAGTAIWYRSGPYTSLPN